MFAHIAIAAMLAALSAAAPAAAPKRASTPHYDVTLQVRLDAPVNGGPAVYESKPVAINLLTSFGNGTSASQIRITNATNVNIDRVECRAFKDAAGVVPGSAAFTKADFAFLSTNVVSIESVLCYVTEGS